MIYSTLVQTFINIYYFFIIKRLGEFNVIYLIKVKTRLPSSENNFKGLMRSPINMVLTSILGIEPESLWDTSLFVTNYTNSIWFHEYIL